MEPPCTFGPMVQIESIVAVYRPVAERGEAIEILKGTGGSSIFLFGAFSVLREMSCGQILVRQASQSCQDGFVHGGSEDRIANAVLGRTGRHQLDFHFGNPSDVVAVGAQARVRETQSGILEADQCPARGARPPRTSARRPDRETPEPLRALGNSGSGSGSTYGGSCAIARPKVSNSDRSSLSTSSSTARIRGIASPAPARGP